MAQHNDPHHVRVGENVNQVGLLTMPLENIEDNVSSYSNPSDDVTSSPSPWSVSDLGTQHGFSPNIHVRDSSEFESQSEISVLESDLAKDEEPDLHLSPIEINDIWPKPGVQTDHTKATNLESLPVPKVKTKSYTSPVSSLSRGESLQDRLFAESHHYPQGCKGFFIPIKALESLIQEQNVVEELTRYLPHTTQREIWDTATRICAIPIAEEKSYRKIFAILVLIEKTGSILEFLGEGVHDGDLPLMKLGLDRKPGIFEFGRKPEEGKASRPLKCFKTFSRINFINFENCQWAVLAPIFGRPRRKDVKHLSLEDQRILPFTEEEEVSEGGFGRVSRVNIHPDHHHFDRSKTSNNQFAIKRLNSHDQEAFDREFEMLSKFSDDANPHLISLLAAYTQRKSFYLIFPWAGADLLQFWLEIKPKPNFEETVPWVATQCAGLASGLLQIHKYESIREPRDSTAANGTLNVPEKSTRIILYGRHGDIKPANILWFPNPKDGNDGGTLKLTDFGLAEFHTLDSRSNLPKSQVATSPSYRAPEYDMVGGKISRSYDIWTMGCLYLEFIAWLLGGWDLVKLFTFKRATQVITPSLEPNDYSFFELLESGKTARTKKSVTEFIKVYLHGHQACTQYLHDFLDLIEKEMLLIETDDANSNKRIECGRLLYKLESMRDKCVNNPGYALTPTPRKEESAVNH